MLIYNYKKEFIGIDAEDLSNLGFSNLEQLRAEVTDFADMFVKTPGHVHNFQHVNWIDFVTCADSTESTKVIIHANSRNFRCLLDIKPAYLTEHATEKAYLVYLNNIRELTNNEDESISANLLLKTAPKPSPVFATPTIEEFVKTVPEITLPEKLEHAPIDLDIPLELNFADDLKDETTLEDDLKIDLDHDEDFNELEEDFNEPDLVQESAQIENEKLITSTEVFDNGYLYDPHVASSELGLPVDLIEEFIEDFIAQAKEFKDELYKSLNDGDNDNVKILSHKLKGVAANLRIEDALESLTIINTSGDVTEVQDELDLFYKIISKLSGEKIMVTKTSQNESLDQGINLDDLDEIDFETDTTSETQEINSNEEEKEIDIFSLPQETENESVELSNEDQSPAEEELEIRMEIPELAGDDFLQIDEDTSNESIKLSEFDEFEELNLENNEDSKTNEDTLVESEDLELEMFSTPEKTQEPLEELSIEEPTLEVPTSNYNTQLVASEIGLSQENFMELFQDYLAEAQDLSSAISDAIENNNSSRWQRKAMQLKGMSDNMRVNGFTRELETLLTTEDTEIANEAIETIKKSITAISKIEE